MPCPHCSSNSIINFGYRQTIAEKQRIFKCDNCKKRFKKFTKKK